MTTPRSAALRSAFVHWLKGESWQAPADETDAEPGAQRAQPTEQKALAGIAVGGIGGGLIAGALLGALGWLLLGLGVLSLVAYLVVGSLRR